MFSSSIFGQLLKLVPRDDFIQPIQELLQDKKRLQQMGQQARQHALAHIGKKACQKALEKMFAHLETNADIKH